MRIKEFNSLFRSAIAFGVVRIVGNGKGECKLQYREDKRSGKQLSILGFGCMRFPTSRGRIDKVKTEALLLKAFERGVNYYDTAYWYDGSEEVVGEIFEKHGIREKVNLATKLPQVACKVPADFDKYFDIQKKRLRTGYIDYYLMHNISDFAQWERLRELGIEDWIQNKKKSGEILQIGFSFHGPHDDFVKMLEAYDWEFTLIQYNYINTNYQAGASGLRKAASKGVPVFIMEPLLGGRLANLSKIATDILQEAKPGSTSVSWALNWLWNDPDITLLLSGMSDDEQLEENLALAEVALPNSFSDAHLQTIQEVKKVFNMSYKIPCTGCNYCMPCTKKINIPACFEAYNASYATTRRKGMFWYLTSVGVLAGTPRYASDCSNCGKCISECPQNINIPKELKNVKRRLQPPGMKKIVQIVGKSMTKVHE